ncbi:MAG: hypothetical protein JW829_16075, partial [Pirellulales bacterium]|nr:hypothetical protein [Pirellulales bacterium]
FSTQTINIFLIFGAELMNVRSAEAIASLRCSQDIRWCLDLSVCSHLDECACVIFVHKPAN